MVSFPIPLTSTRSSEEEGSTPSPTTTTPSMANNTNTNSSVISSTQPYTSMNNDDNEDGIEETTHTPTRQHQTSFQPLTRVGSDRFSLASTSNPLFWTPEEEAAHDTRREDSLVRDLENLQRSHLNQFLILCMIPTVLLSIALILSFQTSGDCESDAVFQCEREAKSLMNLLATRCLCKAIEYSES